MAQFSCQRNVGLKQNREYIITDKNLEENKIIGTPMETKADLHTRVWCTNVNRLCYDAAGGTMMEIASMAKESLADIVACTEINTDTNRYHVKSALYSACKSLSTPQLVTSHNPTPSENEYKPGGTLLLSWERITARLIDSGSDSLGRWSY